MLHSYIHNSHLNRIILCGSASLKYFVYHSLGIFDHWQHCSHISYRTDGLSQYQTF